MITYGPDTDAENERRSQLNRQGTGLTCCGQPAYLPPVVDGREWSEGADCQFHYLNNWGFSPSLDAAQIRERTAWLLKPARAADPRLRE